MTPLAWIAIVGFAVVAVVGGLWQFRIAAAMCTDEFEEGERNRLREEDATPR